MQKPNTFTVDDALAKMRETMGRGELRVACANIAEEPPCAGFAPRCRDR